MRFILFGQSLDNILLTLPIIDKDSYSETIMTNPTSPKSSSKVHAISCLSNSPKRAGDAAKAQAISKFYASHVSQCT